jgi:hypothetical protein
MMAFPNLNEELFSLIISEFHCVTSPLWTIERKSFINIVSDIAINFMIAFENLLRVTFVFKTSRKRQISINFFIVNIAKLVHNFVLKLFVLFKELFVNISKVIFIEAVSFKSCDAHVIEN